MLTRVYKIDKNSLSNGVIHITNDEKLPLSEFKHRITDIIERVVDSEIEYVDDEKHCYSLTYKPKTSKYGLSVISNTDKNVKPFLTLSLTKVYDEYMLILQQNHLVA